MNTIKNSVRLIGNLGGNPDVKTFETGRKMARFSLATTEFRKDAKGNKQSETSWHNLVLFGNVAEVAEKYLHKGKEIAIEGKLVSRSYIAKTGEKKYVTEVEVNELVMLGKADKSEAV
jgi:single-strand DNA-binding protein